MFPDSSPTTAPRPDEIVLDVVIELMKTGGYDAVQLREVARRAHVGLATIYKAFSSRELLIIAALERWMAANPFRGLAMPSDDESLYDGLMRMFRHVFEPWEANPRMLEAFYRARCGEGRDRLGQQGMAAVLPLATEVLRRADPALAEDLGVILVTVVEGVLARFANGQIAVTEILPTLDRTVARLVANNDETLVPLRDETHRARGPDDPPADTTVAPAAGLGGT